MGTDGEQRTTQRTPPGSWVVVPHLAMWDSEARSETRRLRVAVHENKSHHLSPTPRTDSLPLPPSACAAGEGKVLSDHTLTAKLKVIAKPLVKRDTQETGTDACHRRGASGSLGRSDSHDKDCPGPSAFSSGL